MRPPRQHLSHCAPTAAGKWIRRLAGIAILLLAATWVGCTPQKKYQVLSFFFDGVPDPNAPPGSAAEAANLAATARLRHVPAYRHKPFVEGICQPCHLQNLDVDLAHVKEECLSCHPQVEGQFAVMHRPLVTGQCLWCHAPHESELPHLLRADSANLCVQCHDPRMLSPQPIQHTQPSGNCLSCHAGHGGSTPALLRPQPTTSPATQGGAS